MKRPRLHREIFSGVYGPGIGVEVRVPPPRISVHAERNSFFSKCFAPYGGHPFCEDTGLPSLVLP